MLTTLDRALRRARASLTEVECFNYDGTSCIGGLVGHPRIEALYVAERNEGEIIDMVAELEKMAVLRRMCPEVAPLDPTTRYIRIGQKRFPLYLCGGDQVACPTTMAQVLDIARVLSQALRSLHEVGYVLWNLSPRSIYYGDNGSSPRFGPACLISMRKQNFKDFKTSIIHGSTIVSPMQILLDMLSSRFEAETIPFADFKANFSKFWHRVLHPEFRHVPDVVSCYHSLKDGSTDYLDHLLCRWLTISTEKNVRVIVKDPTPLLKPAILCCVDWFALGITLDGYVEALLEKESPPKDLTDAIHSMVINMEPPIFA